MFHTFPVPRPHPRRRIPRRLARPGTVRASAAFPLAAAHFPTPPQQDRRPRAAREIKAARLSGQRGRAPARRGAFPDAPSAGPAAPRPPEGGSAARSFQPPTVRPFPPRPGRIPPARLRRPAALPAIPPAVKPPCFPPPPRLPRPGKTRPARPWPSPRPRPSATHAGASLVSRFPSAAPPPAAARFPTPSVRLPRRLPVDPRARAGYNRCAAARGRADARHLKEE